MKQISSWMNGCCKKSALFLMSLGLCCAAFSTEKDGPVTDFAQNMDYCHYMVAPPGGVQDEFENHYSTALTKALSFLQRRNQDLTMLEAIIVVRSECKARVFEAAKVRMP